MCRHRWPCCGKKQASKRRNGATSTADDDDEDASAEEEKNKHLLLDEDDGATDMEDEDEESKDPARTRGGEQEAIPSGDVFIDAWLRDRDHLPRDMEGRVPIHALIAATSLGSAPTSTSPEAYVRQCRFGGFLGGQLMGWMRDEYRDRLDAPVLSRSAGGAPVSQSDAPSLAGTKRERIGAFFEEVFGSGKITDLVVAELRRWIRRRRSKKKKKSSESLPRLGADLGEERAVSGVSSMTCGSSVLDSNDVELLLEQSAGAGVADHVDEQIQIQSSLDKSASDHHDHSRNRDGVFRFLDYCNWSFERTSLAIAEAVVSRNVGLFRVHLRGDLCWPSAVQQSSCGGGSLSFRERSAGLVALVKADLAKTKDKIDLAKHLQQWEESTSTSSAAETSGRNLGGMNPPTNNFFPPGSRLVRGPPLPSRLLECYTIADVLFAKGLFPLVSDVFRYALASSHRHSTREVVQQPQPLLRTRTKRVPVSYMHAGLFVASLPELFKCCSHKQMGAALLVYVLRREELLKEAGVDGEVIFVNCERMSYSGDLAVVDLHFDFEDQPTKLNEILRAPLSRY
eukprot:g18951.t1